MTAMWPFLSATLLPALLVAAACVWGGAWGWAALLAITVVVFFADKIDIQADVSPATGHRLSEALGGMHFALFAGVAWAMGTDLPLLDKAVIVVSAGLYFGQISNSNAHELIHRADRRAFWLGAANYMVILFGHHTSAHRLVHHVHAATPLDPATARGGEGFWAYLPRTWVGSFRAGLWAERQRHNGVRWPRPYRLYVLGALAALALAWALGGPSGVLGWIVVCAYAQIQLMLSDYVQHYGLERPLRPDGRRVPMGDAHSWNAPHWYSAAMMLNAPRHSAHHVAPARAFPQLELDRDTMPMLPHSLPVMAVIALIPPLWRRAMDGRVAHWRAVQARATPAPA